MTARLAAAACLLAACGRVSFDARSDASLAGDGAVLTLDPPAATINTGSKLQLTASGGVEPYTFAVIGDGWVDAATGLFWAPSHVGKSQVRVTDAASAEATAQVTYRGTTIFQVGGLVAGNATMTVYASTDGASWNVVGSLPAPRANGSLIVYDDRLLYIGGMNGGVPQTTVFASTDGASWTMIGNLPERIVSTGTVVHEGALLKVSGYEGTSDTPDVRRSLDGVSWTSITNVFPTPRHEHDIVTRGAELIVVGGHGAVQYDTMLRSSDDGATWTMAPTSLTFICDFQGMGQLDDLVVRTCGLGCANTESSTNLVAWVPSSLPAERDGPTIVALDNRLVLFGGGLTAILQTTDGVTWTPAGTLPVLVTRASAAAFTPP